MAEIADLAFSQPSPDHIMPTPQPAPYAGDAVFIARFSTLLQQELSKACSILTTVFKRDFHSIGERFDTTESKFDGTAARVNQNSAMDTDLQNRLEKACAKIEDLENRSCHYNVRIQGLPETHTELEGAIQALMKDLIPDISLHQMEVDRIQPLPDQMASRGT